ncbi:MAG: Na+/H+ antiporter subunit E [Oscillospiraceae bacterium]|nr:Na+/H+ antiporter subunit E [Oscillospiraceae bacterium]MBP1556704.1 Na+/H+ antiporter subunit E [Oscillospiraceae bacterium]MBP1577456.1 Na+/H+ antiporter subunit E [Oscillospiraceae bacterium]
MLLLFFAAWVIFNGRITAEILLFGIVITAAMFWFVCRFMGHSLKKELRLYKMLPAFGRYIVLLIKEIISANRAVRHLILTRKEKVEPVLVRFSTDLKSELSRVILANSITLTPGTITVSLKDGEYLVHCLDKSLSEGMEDSPFVKMLKKMEEEG